MGTSFHSHITVIIQISFICKLPSKLIVLTTLWEYCMIILQGTLWCHLFGLKHLWSKASLTSPWCYGTSDIKNTLLLVLTRHVTINLKQAHHNCRLICNEQSLKPYKSETCIHTFDVHLASPVSKQTIAMKAYLIVPLSHEWIQYCYTA